MWLGAPILAAPALFLSTYRLGLLALVACYTLASLAQNLLVGYADVPSLGNVAFFATSAYVAGSIIVLTALPVGLALLLAVLAAGLLGLVVGLPALRISGMHLAIVTVALIFVAQEIMQQWNLSHTQLNSGLTVTVTSPLLEDRGLYLTAAFVSAVGYFLVWNTLRGRTGRALIALSENPIAATAVGINTTLYRLMAFVLSGLLTGVAGCIFLYYGLTVTPSEFTPDLSLAFLTMIILGGRRSLGGSLLGGLIIGFLPQALTLLPAHIGSIDVQGSTAALYALLLLTTLWLFPDGVWNSLASRVKGRFDEAGQTQP
jgi:branched-chain amino acid transport system permease protein